MPTIKARIIKARRVLKVYRENHPDYNGHPEEPDTQALEDMAADLMHLYKKLGRDPADLLRIANDHFTAEHRHQDEPGEIPWTVIGMYDGGEPEITADKVQAKGGFEAFARALGDRAARGEVNLFNVICSFPGSPQGFEYADDLTNEQTAILDTIKNPDLAGKEA